ncbi:MAG: hypothetical protein JRI25_07335 [Deltaproteobacteria bacterium]|nr:hypothetical protein [Deltaproteobacteria bacterium]MBW2254394.1 hypothetical protein [Deltaproteobacteria bacterium]
MVLIPSPQGRCTLFYPTYLDDDTVLLMETETSGAFMKSDLEERPEPEKATENAVKSAQLLAMYVADKLKPVLVDRGVAAEISFSIRCDGNGSVMVAQDSARGQLACKLIIQP